MSDKNNKSKRFVIIMSVVVIFIIILGSWLTWKIVKDGMDNNAYKTNNEQPIIIQNEVKQVTYLSGNLK